MYHEDKSDITLHYVQLNVTLKKIMRKYLHVAKTTTRGMLLSHWPIHYFLFTYNHTWQSGFTFGKAQGYGLWLLQFLYILLISNLQFVLVPATHPKILSTK